VPPVVFAVLAALVVLSALAVVLHPQPVYSALALVVTLFQLAVFFVALDAHMVAALQIIVYAGAIMVLFLFVVMLLGAPAPGPVLAPRALQRAAGLLGAAGLGAGLVALLGRGPLAAPPAGPAEFGSTVALGTELFTTYLLPFELTSVLLLVAVVGAVILAKGR
jgi:NADH-quinone oxidoreductase subunit J